MKIPVINFLLLSACVVHGQTMINIDLGAGTTVGSGTAGVVASDGWQQESSTPNFTDRALDYEDSSASGATLTLANATGNVSSTGAATIDGNYDMYNRGAGIGGVTATTLSVAGLDTAGVFANGYDVYVYIASAVNFGAGVNVVTTRVGNGTTDYFLDVNESLTSYTGAFSQATATIAGDAVESSNYVLFSDMSGASFTIDAINISTTTNSAALFTGMQIVAVPEPSSFAALAGLLSFGFVALRRRSRKA